MAAPAAQNGPFLHVVDNKLDNVFLPQAACAPRELCSKDGNRVEKCHKITIDPNKS